MALSACLRLSSLWNDEDALDYAAASWYIIEGERLLDEIEETAGDLENVRKKWENGKGGPANRPRKISEFEEKP